MSQLGMGVMLHHLGGGSEHGAEEYVGQRIMAADITEERLRLAMSGGKFIEVYDNGQLCCEHRYMQQEDDVSWLVGKTLRGMEVKSAPSIGDDDYGEHEVCFLEVQTDDGSITISNHNNHNGYYGGFAMAIREVDA